MSLLKRAGCFKQLSIALKTGEKWFMKVVLFCGGLGLRILDAEDIPKPMVQIDYRSILWHVIKYYAHYGHKDLILCSDIAPTL